MELDWKAYLLRPSPEPRTIEKFTAYTRSWQRPAEAEPTITFREWSGEHQPPSHSMPPAVGGKVAEQFGSTAWARFHIGMLEAYFVDNRTVSDRSVLREVAEASGIDGDDFDTRFDEQEQDLTAAVIADHNAAIEVGVTGVPAVVINEVFPVMGAQDLDFYRRVIDNLLAKEV